MQRLSNVCLLLAVLFLIVSVALVHLQTQFTRHLADEVEYRRTINKALSSQNSSLNSLGEASRLNSQAIANTTKAVLAIAHKD